MSSANNDGPGPSSIVLPSKIVDDIASILEVGSMQLPAPTSEQDFVNGFASHPRAYVRWINDVCTDQRNAQALLIETRNHATAITEELELAQNELAALRTQLAANPTSVRAPLAAKSEKIPDPSIFDGTRSKLDDFITDIRLKLQYNDDRFMDDGHKFAYIVSRTSDKAKDQLRPFISSPDNLTAVRPTSAEALLILQRAFGDPDRKGTAQRTITTLRQKNKEFASYLAEFQRHIEYTEWNDEAKKSALLAGLSTELKTHLITVDVESMILAQVIALCQRIDNRHRATQSALNFFRSASTGAAVPKGNASRPAWNAVSAPPTPAPNPDAMDLSVARSRPRGPLTAAEKERRRALGLCFYCGGPGHSASTCPLSPKDRVPSGAPTMRLQLTNAAGASPPENSEKA